MFLRFPSQAILTRPPCIQKPEQLWSDKQVMSSLIHTALPRDKARLTFVFKAATKVLMR